MDQALQVFMNYAAAFEETYRDDDWSRLAAYFAPDASYEVRGGPYACLINGRDAIFAGLKKSLDGLDRRCSDRRIELLDGPHASRADDGESLEMSWRASYRYGDAPAVALDGRSAVTVSGGVIVALRDEYDDAKMQPVAAWMSEFGAGLDGSYV